MKKLISTLLFSTTFVFAWAQASPGDEQNKNTQEEASPLTREVLKYTPIGHLKEGEVVSKRLPNYGSLLVGSGLNFLSNSPSEIDFENLQVRFSDVSLHCNIHLGRSHFVLSPGMGLSFERYRLKDAYVLEHDSTGTVFKSSSADPPVLSVLDIRYFDFCMLELRFNAESKCPKDGFFAALGCKAGMCWKACSTVQYKRDDEIQERNNWESFDLNKVRYGLYARVGWGRFGLCCTRILSTLFQENEGPGKTDAKSWSLGLSVDLF